MDAQAKTPTQDQTNDQTGTTDDQELAKVLAGMNQQTEALSQDTAAPADDASQQAGMQFEETNAAAAEPSPTPVAEPADNQAQPAVTPVHADDASASPELESIKKTALEELRPLVDRLDLPAAEKFDTLLLIIRSTDDQSLVTAAHEAARAIEDETKRAQALLDVIKEIDYFAGHGQPPQ